MNVYTWFNPAKSVVAVEYFRFPPVTNTRPSVRNEIPEHQMLTGLPVPGSIGGNTAVNAPEPVPFVVSGGGVRSDGSEAFGEGACAAGSLGSLRGIDILPRLTALMRG